MLKNIFVIVGILAGLAIFVYFLAQPGSVVKSGAVAPENIDKPSPIDVRTLEITSPSPAAVPSQPAMSIDPESSYSAVLKTSLGEITISLNAKATPVTVNNFIYLARKNFYNNTIFHRVIKGFMIQGGDPKADGTGGPGYRFNDEPVTGDYNRGTVAMANSGPNTNGSQFFIMHQANHLAKNYVIFGQVVSGMEVVDKIADSPVLAGAGGEASKPVSPTVIETATIVGK